MWPANRHAKCTQFGDPPNAPKAHSMINHSYIHIWDDVCLGAGGGHETHAPYITEQHNLGIQNYIVFNLFFAPDNSFKKTHRTRRYIVNALLPYKTAPTKHTSVFGESVSYPYWSKKVKHSSTQLMNMSEKNYQLAYMNLIFTLISRLRVP